MANISSAVINCSAPYYNLGAHKIADRSGALYCDGDPGLFLGAVDRIYLSVIFSWDVQTALQVAMRYKGIADIECGGPGMFALASWWKDKTGIAVHRGLDQRFEKQSGDYKMTFASRGCPVNCSFCIVPRIEGTEFTLNWDFTPAPMLCDNNLSALPVEFQEHIIRRYLETGTKLIDANSGFEPRAFDEGTYKRWKPILRGPWRFALDDQGELGFVERMMRILKDETPVKKQVYVLIGNEPIESCYERAQKVIEWGGQPYVQPVMPLNALSRDNLLVRHDWTHTKLRDMQRYYNRHLWHSIKINEYVARVGDKPFRELTWA